MQRRITVLWGPEPRQVGTPPHPFHLQSPHSHLVLLLGSKARGLPKFRLPSTPSEEWGQECWAGGRDPRPCSPAEASGRWTEQDKFLHPEPAPRQECQVGGAGCRGDHFSRAPQLAGTLGMGSVGPVANLPMV